MELNARRALIFAVVVFAAIALYGAYSSGQFDGGDEGDGAEGGGIEPDGGPGVIAQAVNAATNAATNPTSMSDAGLAMLGRLEGFSATAYPDYKGSSIGFGHLIKAGEEYLLSAVITPAEAAQLETSDVSWAERAVSAAVSAPLTQAQFDALVSFCFNVGAPKFKASTLVRLLNDGDYAGAANEFAKWNKAGGSVNASLQVRREREESLFIGGVYA